MSAPDDATLRALMAARTQGTWHDCYVDTGLREIYGDDGLVAAVGDPNTVHPNDPAASAAEADAQLVAIAPELAAEVLWLRERVALRDDVADAYDVLVRRVWEAATGDTHEGPASVDVLLEAVAGLRARAEKAEAARDALRAAAREYLAAHDATDAALTEVDSTPHDPLCSELFGAERAAEAGLRTLAGEG